jgi:hypothetical protein
MTTKPSPSALLSHLEDGIGALTSSEAWHDYLAFQSRFHRYSYGNVLLIAAQRADATKVAGFRSWQRVNRFVRRGEKAIWILAPMIGRAASGTRHGETDDQERVISGFRYVPVFDVSQTVGEDLPAMCHKLSGADDSGAYDRFVAVATTIGFRVVDHRFTDTTNGDCSRAHRRIRIEAGNTPAQRVKTLVHEIAHALLHETVEDRALAELEAESTAYVVCRAIGMDTGDYSFGYVATWAGGGEAAMALIKSSCGRIQTAAATILEGGTNRKDAVEQAA